MDRTKQKQLEADARALHEAWVSHIGPGRVSASAAEWVIADVRQRCGGLRARLDRGELDPEAHNDQRFLMTMALRRLIDTGGEERASRLVAREMHDLFVDSPPLPHAKYRFTFDWVSPHAGALAKDLAHLAGRPGVRGLEIGCFEGQSACWFLENVVTDATSRLVCVDPFAIPMDSTLLRYFERYFDHNVAASGGGDRVLKLVGSSQVILRTLAPNSFDFVYVDGSHRVGDVLQDAVLAWTILKPGGTAIFDDYDLVDDVAKGLFGRAPGRALDAFVALVDGQVMRKDWQLVMRKAGAS
jgi:predicted O-methyltransferase YrrM